MSRWWQLSPRVHNPFLTINTPTFLLFFFILRASYLFRCYFLRSILRVVYSPSVKSIPSDRFALSQGTYPCNFRKILLPRNVIYYYMTFQLLHDLCLFLTAWYVYICVYMRLILKLCHQFLKFCLSTHSPLFKGTRRYQSGAPSLIAVDSPRFLSADSDATL